MVGNYYTLASVADSLARLLPGSVLGRMVSQERDELVVGFEDLEQVLVISCRPGETTCFLHPHFSRARRNSVELLPEARGRVIESLWLPPSDRVLVLSCRDGTRLLLQLYSPRANVVLADREGKILNAFKHATELRGSVFEFRGGDGLDRHDSLSDQCGTSPRASLLQVLKSWMPELGPVLCGELLVRAELDGASPAETLQRTQIMRLEREAESLRQEIRQPQPRVYLAAGKDAVLFSLVALHHRAGAEQREFEDIHEAIRFTVYRRRSANVFLARKKDLLHRLHQTVERTARSLRGHRANQAAGSRGESYQLFGELLLAHLHEIPEGAPEVELPHGTGRAKIVLDPSMSIARNAQRYFEKARTARRAAEESLTRGLFLERRSALAAEMLGAVEACPDRHHLEELMRTRRDAVEALGLTAKADEREETPFRVFVVDGGFEVWAGKNSANNELLTLRYARPNDLWFHARGSGGSHVILRTASAPGTPGKRAREQAAAIAAYYSKMRKASLVPVTVTEKKHVRKPRGAPVGTVQVERESVLFAAPALPGQTRHS
jgi:predicted ribosome quality control (RQC) complex YloA/Tae2 family protein